MRLFSFQIASTGHIQQRSEMLGNSATRFGRKDRLTSIEFTAADRIGQMKPNSIVPGSGEAGQGLIEATGNCIVDFLSVGWPSLLLEGDGSIRLRLGLPCVALAASIWLPSVALAQPAFTLPPPAFELPGLPSVSGSWTVMVGIGGKYEPSFEGARHGKPIPVPIFSVRRTGFTDQFRGPRDSSSIALIDFGDFRAGPAGKIVSARKSRDYSELIGLGDVKTAFEVGGFVEYFPVDWLRGRAELRRGFGGHQGVVADLSADAIVPVMQRFIVSAGPRFTWESTAATSPYFGIDTVQAMAAGLPVFNAKGGAHSVGAGAQISYHVDPKWEVHAYVEYQRLLGDAAASPLVALRGLPNQTAVGIGASYSFDFKVR
jgi:outer membrane protein